MAPMMVKLQKSLELCSNKLFNEEAAQIPLRVKQSDGGHPDEQAQEEMANNPLVQ